MPNRMSSTPRAKAQIRCDSCQAVVRSARQVSKYNALGVDWVHCAKCDRRDRFEDETSPDLTGRADA